MLFDNEKIENGIVAISSMENIFLRYFPQSYIKWKERYFYYEPINLVEFYLKNQYKQTFEMTLKSIFGSLGNLIKFARNYETFSTALKKTNLEVHFYYGDFMSFANVPDLKILIEATVGLNNASNNDMNFFSLSSEIERGGILLILKNKYLILNKNYFNCLENIFIDLKNMLK